MQDWGRWKVGAAPLLCLAGGLQAHAGAVFILVARDLVVRAHFQACVAWMGIAIQPL